MFIKIPFLSILRNVTSCHMVEFFNSSYINSAAKNQIMDKFSNPANIYALVIGLILVIPFLHFATTLIRQRWKSNINLLPGIFFCLAAALNCVGSFIYEFTFSFNYHSNDANVFNRSYKFTTEIYFIALAFYFNSIINLIKIFEVAGVKIMVYIIYFFILFFSIALAFRILLIYVNFPENISEKFNAANSFYYQLTIYYENIILCFCFVILSIAFVLSNMSTFIPINMRKKVVILIFLYPISQYVGNILVSIKDDKIFTLWAGALPWRRYLQNFLFLCYKLFDFYILAFIVWIVSVSGLEAAHQYSDPGIQRPLEIEFDSSSEY